MAETEEPAEIHQGPKYGAARSRKTGWRRLLSWKAFGFAALGLFLLGVAGVGIAYAVVPIPEPNDFSTSDSTIVYYDDGATELGRFSVENRQIVDSADIPETLKQATVAAEDRSFYDNPGFDVVGIARSTWGAIRGEYAGGGSTITQQYVKNFYLTQDRELTRKLREIVIAVKIDQDIDKDQILADYLNTIWFGRGTYGVQTAARSYFGVDVADLELNQSVALAAILRSPTRYDPTVSPENAERFAQRFQYVLDGMVQTGAIDRTTAAAVQLPEVLPEQRTDRYGGPNGYLLLMVRDELIANGFEEAEIDTGGLRVTTSFNAQAQASAVKAVEEQRPTEDAERVHVGLAAVRPNDGGIVAVYGGPDAVTQDFNDAVDAQPQGGSTVKAFTLAAGLENGASLRSRYWGNSPFDPPSLGPPVNNQFDRDYGRSVSLLKATEDSINTAYVDLTMDIGSEKVVDAIERAGITDAPGLVADPRVTLGVASISAVKMAGGYATLAAQGVQTDTYAVAEVTDRGGNVRYSHETAPEKVFEDDVMADVTYALTQVVEEGSGTRAQDLDRPVAGKTGTHEDLTAWFSGYTPQLAASVVYFRGEGEGLGTESLDGVAGMPTFTGGRYPAATWTAFMQGALEGQPVEEFPEPADIRPERPTDDATDSGDDQREAPEEQPTEEPSEEAPPPETQPPAETPPPETVEPEPPPPTATETVVPEPPPLDPTLEPPLPEEPVPPPPTDGGG